MGGQVKLDFGILCVHFFGQFRYFDVILDGFVYRLDSCPLYNGFFDILFFVLGCNRSDVACFYFAVCIL